MRKNEKLNSIGTAFAIMLVMVFSLTLIYGGKAYAQSNYFNSYYLGINGGVIQTSPGGLSSKSGTTFNMSFGKNFNFNNVIIGGEVALGYSSNGSWTYTNYTASLHSVYYIAAVKAGYAFNNIMPFVKLGYVGYSYDVGYSFPESTYAITSKVSKEGGLLYGAGVEYAFNRTWDITLQYFGASLPDSDKTGNFTLGVDFNF